MTEPARWIDKDGKALSCKDKLATLDDNLDELLEIALDALEDAAVMGLMFLLRGRFFLNEIAALEPRFVAKATDENNASDATGTVAASKPAES